VNYGCDLGADGWSFSGRVAPYDAMVTSTGQSRLGLTPAGSLKAFSYWYSPDIGVQNARTYRASFGLISSNADHNETLQFRMRVNQRNSWQSWERVVNSYNQQAPSNGSIRYYYVDFDPTVTGTTDNKVFMSWDLMSFDPSDNENSWLYMTDAKVQQITIEP